MSDELLPSHVVYIDESGDVGFNFQTTSRKGSSRWFVLSAVIAEFEAEKSFVPLMRELRVKLNLQRNQIVHFCDLRHEYRIPIVAALASAPIKIVCVLIDKQAEGMSDVFKQKPERLYFYATRLLLERVSWFCRDHSMKNRRPARLIFEHRRHLSYSKLSEYFALLQSKDTKGQDEFEGVLKREVKIEWSAIDTANVQPAGKGQYAGLQFADCVACSIAWALEKRFQYTEHRFAKMLRSVTYAYNNKFLSYGLKFFPKQPTTDPELNHWVDKYYQ
jgi:hypothetical protein